MNRALTASTPFPYRNNSLNIFRLFLAALVLFAHSFYIFGAGDGPHIQGENLGGWAVAGFFVLSGFLITRSRLNTSAGDYLLHRVARIFPAFLVCLVLTALVFAPIAMLVEHGTLEGFLSNPVSPLEYIWGNITLLVNHYNIGITLQGVPYPGAWNGSLWTLFFEFCCYMIVWVLGGLAIFRRNATLAIVVYAASLGVLAASNVAAAWGLNGNFLLLAKLAPFFLAGSAIYFLVDRRGTNPIAGCASLIVAIALMVFVPKLGGALGAPFLAYGLLWLSTVIRQPRWIAKNDISYGFYIYAWPMQQMLILLGAGSLGFIGYTAACAIVTAILAYLSWVLIERPIMRQVRTKPHAPVAAPAS